MTICSTVSATVLFLILVINFSRPWLMLEYSCLATAGVYPSWRQYIMLRNTTKLAYYYSSRTQNNTILLSDLPSPGVKIVYVKCSSRVLLDMTRVWIVAQKKKSAYKDVEGKSYEYPASIPNGKQISKGDYLICSRTKAEAKAGKRIIGVGRIEAIQIQRDAFTGKEIRTADYGWYRDLPFGFSFDEIGGDPRLNSQHSISSVVDNREEEILGILLGELADDIEVQSTEEKMDEQISPSPYRKGKTIVREDSSNVQGQQTPFGNWLEATLIQRGMTQTTLARLSGVSGASIGKIIRGEIRNPRKSTRTMIEGALGHDLDESIEISIAEEVNIEGLGEFSDFDPHSDTNLWPEGGGVYVFYDISHRPIYVGQSGNIQRRLKDYLEGTRRPWWFARPIVESASFIPVEDEHLRKQLEKVMILFLKSNAVLNKTFVYRD
jgi:transcriptional regulator with XRE-family HTH domain